MKLIENWREILRRAWSVRFMLLAALFTGAEAVLPLLVDSMPRGLFAVLSFVAVSGGLAARFVMQKGL